MSKISPSDWFSRISLPDVSKYKDKSKWMHDCISTAMDEGRGRDQAIAMCMNIWRNRKKKKSSSSDSGG